MLVLSTLMKLLITIYKALQKLLRMKRIIIHYNRKPATFLRLFIIAILLHMDREEADQEKIVHHSNWPSTAIVNNRIVIP